MKIPFFGKERYYQDNKDQILKIIEKVYLHGKVVMGPEVDDFEKKIAKYCDRKYGVAVGSCTDALYFSFLTAGIKKDDEVLLTGFSFIASVTCILRAGGSPVFVDIDPKTYMMDSKDLENKITDKTRFILAVDIFGDALNIVELEAIGKKYGLTIIEDAAQSIGSKYNDRKVGSLGLCSCISFDPTKILSAQSNGGIILTDDFDFYETLCKLRYHGKNKIGEFEILGFNSRISSAQAAILSFNLDNLNFWIGRHREIADMYFRGLSNISQLKMPLNRRETRHVYHKFVMRTEKRNDLKKWLIENNIGCMIHYDKALLENKLFENFIFRAEGLNVINKIKKEVISLPIHAWLTDEEVNYIIQKIKEFYQKP
ncbi:MAG TPA: DegT/DnrJ/EryC1/StrS family aminotransferase [Candidatus Nanoarchaeia archaeon]|nr:DegT/DnrJ/EryC1/StrS family aminotransferase [Candidatus Nanoarchaeia archaeon]